MRLKQAREYARLSQAQLAEAIENACSQVNISKLERSQATGSEFTAQFASACGVNALWLATGQGEMVDSYNFRDERIRHIAMVAENLPDYAVDQAIRDIDSIAELIKRAEEHNKKAS